MANIWAPSSYGYSPIYWVTVSGIPTVFIERESGMSLPSGWTSEDASLVIDDSAMVGTDHIDRDRGVGVGLDFSAKLLDTSTVRDWMRRWSLQATLASNVAATDSTITVDSTTGWPSSGTLYVGLEAISYTGTTPTSFTGCSRAQSGSLANAYKVGTTGQIVTDRPRSWRGREVVLWATMASPSGHISGASLDAEATQLWRGRITGGPDRATDGFVLSCQSLDRVLDVPLAGRVAGSVLSTSKKYLVTPSWSISINIDARNGTDTPGSVYEYSVKLAPFAGDAPGTFYSGAEIRTAIESAWTTAVSALGAGGDLGSLIHKPRPDGAYDMCVTIVNNANIQRVLWSVLELASVGTFSEGQHNFGSLGMGGGYDYQAPVSTTQGDGTLAADAKPQSVSVTLDDGDPNTVPSIGKVRIKNGNLACTYSYSAVDVGEADLYLAGLEPVPNQVALTASQMEGGEVEILAVDAGTDGQGDAWSNLALRCLMSSGTGERSATYDTLPLGQGYGIDEAVVDEDSFTAGFDSGPLGSLLGNVALAGRSWVDIFGGPLALFRKAVVCKPGSDGVVRLSVVETGPSASYSTTITDADLLSHQDDPVVSVARADSPNSVAVIAEPGGDGSNALRLVYNAQADIDARGRVEVEYRVDATDRDALASAARIATVGAFAHDATLQAVELLVHPSVEAEVGDIIWFTSVHPALWTWSTSPGQPGYDGPGRVVGRRTELKTGRAVLTVLIDGATRINALCPAAEVSNYAGTAGAPTTIDIPLYFLSHFSKALSEQGGNISVLHYQPGQAEGSSEGYVISDAAEVSGICRLTVASVTGTPTLDTSKRSTLTLPLTSGATDYQDNFAHAGDGTVWG